MTNQRYYPQATPSFSGLAQIEPQRKTANTTNPPARPNAMEKHYSLEEVAEAWGISVRSARRIFRDQPGVADLTIHRSLTTRSYQVLRVPASVAARVHESRSAGFVLGAKRKVKR
jgi:AraC-like DNA-binding protein